MEMMVDQIPLMDKVILDLVVVALEVLESTDDIQLNPVPIMMVVEMVDLDNHLLVFLHLCLHPLFLHLSDLLGHQ
tara:strand:- start:272 stop:496 length:225 start_codon:yes stop_codon:yes gene_type:complete